MEPSHWLCPVVRHNRILGTERMSHMRGAEHVKQSSKMTLNVCTLSWCVKTCFCMAFTLKAHEPASFTIHKITSGRTSLPFTLPLLLYLSYLYLIPRCISYNSELSYTLRWHTFKHRSATCVITKKLLGVLRETDIAYTDIWWYTYIVYPNN
jgi:hypothetical protein